MSEETFEELSSFLESEESILLFDQPDSFELENTSYFDCYLDYLGD